MKRENIFVGKKLIVGLIAFFITLPTLSYSWARTGHEVAAMVAQSLLQPSTIQALDDLRKDSQVQASQLKTHADVFPYQYIDESLAVFLDKSKKLNLSLISNWPDGWGVNHKETKAWHFIDIPTDVKTIGPGDLVRYCPNQACVVEQIKNQSRILGDKTQSPTERLKALFFIVHFVADIHQPLHCTTDSFINIPASKIPAHHNGDNGGNLKVVRFFGEGTEAAYYF